MAEGKAVHKALELRIADGTPLPPQYHKYEPLALGILRTPGRALTESQMTLTQSLTPTGWFAKDAWCRVMVDVMKINGANAWAGDWKTGKVKLDEHQLELTAAVIMTQYTEVQTVATSFIWLRDSILDSRTYHRDGLAKLWDRLLVVPAQIQESAATNNWPANPSKRHCGYCPVNGLGKCAKAAAPFRG